MHRKPTKGKYFKNKHVKSYLNITGSSIVVVVLVEEEMVLNCGIGFGCQWSMVEKYSLLVATNVH